MKKLTDGIKKPLFSKRTNEAGICMLLMKGQLSKQAVIQLAVSRKKRNAKFMAASCEMDSFRFQKMVLQWPGQAVLS
ncbi:MAG: hypothetical protein HUJ54_06430 [Erysipelotrichaceae bacterium]|nr:hypothetical protein [Erysipelotrichaceae bacterium]